MPYAPCFHGCKCQIGHLFRTKRNVRKASRNQIVIICSKHENHAKPGEEILPQKQKVARLLDLIQQ